MRIAFMVEVKIRQNESGEIERKQHFLIQPASAKVDSEGFRVAALHSCDQALLNEKNIWANDAEYSFSTKVLQFEFLP